MYKRLPALGAALVWAALLAGCGGGSAGAGVVSANGSTSLEQVMGILMESYREICPEVTVNYTGSGSGAGIAGVIAGTCDLGLSSRPLKEQELAQGIRAHLLALDGLAVVVHPNNPAEDLALEEIARIFRGEVSTWAELGWEDRPVAVIGREAGSGTRGAFESIVGVEGRCAYTNELTSTGDVLANVASNPNAIG
ncbi:MAG: phosphate ABC transporter phosphate-binding protein, partial [Oscillospiraceae bacterium]|nr:phosphate ABC transporter phosphate-binding protein [Oscillospiraceae bacterium]